MTSLNNIQRNILQNLFNGKINATNDTSALTQSTEITLSDEELIAKSLDKYLQDFSEGNITHKAFETIMQGFGAENFSQTIENGNVVQKFTVNGKSFTLVCNQEAAESGTDNITDETGNYTTMEKTQNGSVASKYDNDGKLLSKTFFKPDGSTDYVIENNYDKYGQKLGFIQTKYNENSQVTETSIYKYDASTGKSRPICTYANNADGTVTMFGYDATGNKIEILTDDANSMKQMPSLNELTTKTTKYLSGSGNTVYYDKNGNPIYKETFDANGKLTSISYHNYDAENNKNSEVYMRLNANGEVTYKALYDENKKTLSSTSYKADGSKSKLEYTYDENGKLAGLEKSNYDANGLLTDVTTKNKAGKVLSENHYAADGKTVEYTVEYQYDKTGKAIGNTKTTFDANGNVKQIDLYRKDSSTLQNVLQNSFVYNDDGTVSINILDGKGNLKELTKIPQNEFVMPNIATKSETKKLANGTKTVTYLDANGNVVYTESYGKNGVKTDAKYNKYNKNDEPDGYINVAFKENGNISEVTEKNQNNNMVLKRLFNADGNIYHETKYHFEDGKSNGYTKTNYRADGTLSDVTTRNKKGKIVLSEKYDENGVIQNRIENQYNEKGKLIGYTDTSYNNGKVINRIAAAMDENGKRIGYTSNTVSDTSEIIIYSYDENGNEIKQNMYRKNEDGTITMFGLNPDGSSFELKTFKEGEIALANIIDSSKTTQTKNEKGYAVTEYRDTNNNIVYTETQFPGNQIQKTYYQYDANGNFVGTLETSNNYNGGINKVVEKDVDGNVLSNTVYNSYGQIGKKEIFEYDEFGFNTSKTEVYYDRQGNISSEYITDSYGNCLRDARYDENGNFVSLCETEVDENGKITRSTLNEYYQGGKIKNSKVLNYALNGNQINTTTKYDENGNKLSTNITLTEPSKKPKQVNDLISYNYNADGTVTVFGYDANGKKVELKTFHSDDIITMDNIDLSKTTTTTDENGYTTVSYVDNNGNVVYSERLNPKGELLDKSYNFYDKNGKQVDNTKIVIKEDVVETPKEEKPATPPVQKEEPVTPPVTETTPEVENSTETEEEQQQAQIETIKNADGKTIGFTKSFVDAQTELNTVELYSYDKNGKEIPQNSYVSEKDGFTSLYAYINGQKILISKYDDENVVSFKPVDYTKDPFVEKLDNGKQNIHYKDANGNVVYYDTYDKNGKNTGRTYLKYDKNGEVVSQIAVTYNTEGKVKETVETDKNGRTIGKVIYLKDGSVRKCEYDYEYNEKGDIQEYKYYTFESGSNKKLEFEMRYEYDKKGNPLYKRGILLNEDGSINRITTQTYINGKWKYAADILSNSESSSYNQITQIGNGLILTEVRNQKGYHGANFLYAALGQGMPGATATIKHGSSRYNKYEEYLNNVISNEITKEYGYKPEDLVGYYFGPTSSLATAIKGNKDFLNFINKNKDKLKEGFSVNDGDSAMSMAFSYANSPDLYYALHGVSVIESWVDENNQLHIIISDTYDFAGEGHGSGRGDLCAAGDAAMKEGTFKPYYTMTEVVIPL